MDKTVEQIIERITSTTGATREEILSKSQSVRSVALRHVLVEKLYNCGYTMKDAARQAGRTASSFSRQWKATPLYEHFNRLYDTKKEL